MEGQRGVRNLRWKTLSTEWDMLIHHISWALVLSSPMLGQEM